MKLNLGCGKKYLETFTNVDVQHIEGAKCPDVLCDLKALPFKDDSADEILSVHVVEHFFRWEVGPLLREWWRVLKPGGKMVLELPDVLKAARNLLAGMGDQMAMWPLYGDDTLKDPYMCHKYGWSEQTLKRELEACGFRDVKIRKPQFHGGRENRDMRLECVK
jgi:ubiquinone/menaquinone biosynthesis C-methylase UbiE